MAESTEFEMLERAPVGRTAIAEETADEMTDEAEARAEETGAEGSIDIDPDCMAPEAAIVPFIIACWKKLRKKAWAAVSLLAQMLEKSLTVETGALGEVKVSLM